MDTRPRFKWRIIPGYFLVTFGGLLVYLSALNSLVLLVLPLDQLPTGNLAAMALVTLGGTIWITAGILTLKGRYWWGLMAIAAGYLVGVGGANLVWP